jgi:hypothetical protein
MVEGHHCRPPCDVGTPSAFNPRAIWPRLLPPACSRRTRAMTSLEIPVLRPALAGGPGVARALRLRSATKRSSSSTGMRRVPQPVSMVSTKGRTRRMNVERLIPSAVAAWVRVYASRSTWAASRTTTRGASVRRFDSSACLRPFWVFRRPRRLRDIRTTYMTPETDLHPDASPSRVLLG